MNELINRPEYLNQLIQHKDVDLVKIVTGIRRCGKSSLLNLFHQYLLDNGVPDTSIIHMNLESLQYLQFGGMPILREYQFNEARSNQALEGIYSTVVLRDILQRNNQADQGCCKKLCCSFAPTLEASHLQTVSEIFYPMKGIFRPVKEKMSQAKQ